MNQVENRRVWSCRLSGEEYEERCRLEEALRRREGDFVEDARALQRYIALCGISQEECARRLGRSQSSVGNRLRLMNLPTDVLEGLRGAGLTERHARALLRLTSGEEQRQCLSLMASERLSCAEAEALVETMLPGRSAMGLGNAGILLNSFERSAERLRRCGVPCSLERQEDEEELVLKITVGRRRRGAKSGKV